MPKEKEYTINIHKIYKRKYEDLGMFFFVEGLRSVVPAVSIEQAIFNYFRYLGIEDFNSDSAMVTFTRMKREFYESIRS
jgi:hypothetical protein